jgi:hypothetical protein
LQIQGGKEMTSFNFAVWMYNVFVVGITG